MTCHVMYMRIVERLVWEDDGQDVVEYALLAAFLGIVGYVALTGRCHRGVQRPYCGLARSVSAWKQGLGIHPRLPGTSHRHMR